jgi:ATP-dependent DNA helicase RecQ
MGLQQTYIRYLDSFFRHYYLCRYLPLSAGKDIFSQSLLRFKRRIQPDLDAWIDCSLELLEEVPFSNETIILRALQHDETSARKDFPTALDILGQRLSDHFDCRYLPSLLVKSRSTLPCKQLTSRQRLAELRDIYSIGPLAAIPSRDTTPNAICPAPASSTPAADSPPPPFLLIDDILTTGATMHTLIHTLRQHFPTCPIRIFTLTLADYQILPRQQPPPACETAASYSVEALKSEILANTV